MYFFFITSGHKVTSFTRVWHSRVASKRPCPTTLEQRLVREESRHFWQQSAPRMLKCSARVAVNKAANQQANGRSIRHRSDKACMTEQRLARAGSGSIATKVLLQRNAFTVGTMKLRHCIRYAKPHSAGLRRLGYHKRELRRPCEAAWCL